MSRRKPPEPTTSIRCAIYTRKSTEEGLQQEFNTLDAQRESAEAFIRSQQHEGWVCSPVRYDDGGFTGGNMDRPALRRLMADIDAGKVDCVVVYKVDRLSRSLLDFARMMETFDKHRVSFVSVTQQFNTTHSMGRLTLNILLSFAQFEREIISERTRDKIAAARRKGRWSGGRPILGYDIDRQASKLVVNSDEAIRVRAIFQLYLELESLLPVVHELSRRGWTNKVWTTSKGDTRGGLAFTKTSLHKLLTNVTYAGLVQYKTEIHPGQHEAIVDRSTWDRVQSQLARNGNSGGIEVRNRFGALLKGLLFCSACDCAMTPAHSTRNKTKRYRYYVCTTAQKLGWDACPTKSIPAGEIERFVVEQVQAIGSDPELIAETFGAAQAQTHERLTELDSEHRILIRDLGRWHAEIAKLGAESNGSELDSPAVARLADLTDRVRLAEQRRTAIGDERDQLRQSALEETVVEPTMKEFGGLWESMTPHEQRRVIQLLLERIDFDAEKGSVSLTFHPDGFGRLIQEQTERQTEEAV